MRLKDYPRPKNDTGIGFHWFPDTRHYDRGYLDIFLPRLKKMGVSWLVIISNPTPNNPIPEYFVRALVDNNIEPVIRIATETVSYHDQNDLKKLCQTYANWGVNYIHVYNEPNLKNAWPSWEWNPQGLPDRFMNALLPCLETMYTVPGIIPVFTPLSPGGDYWDLPFLATCLDIINQQGKRYLFNKLAVGIHNYAFNRPLDWGEGAQNRWPCAQPYQQPGGCEDQLGFRLFEWYDWLIRYKVGFSLPLIGTESGVHLGDQRAPSYPAIDQNSHDQRSADMVRLVMESQVPNYVFNNAYWLLATEDDGGFAYQRWFRPSGEAVVPRSVATLETMAKENRKFRIHIAELIRVVKPDGAVQVMDLEDYLKGVVPPEVGTSAHPEALKAQAVAARSYAAKAVEFPRHREANADICTTTHCQVWRPNHYPATDAAVENTRGMVGAYDNEIIFAFYFGHCNGHTKNSEDVWSTALPYCRSVECIAIYPEFYGHGVGMCQRGAMAMGERGANFVGILIHYYSGITVVDGRTGEKVNIPPIGISPDPSPLPDLPPLELEDWPRPLLDNGLGIQGGGDFGDDGLDADIERVKDLGMRWVYLLPNGSKELKRAVNRYWEEGIMPLVRPQALIDEEHDFLADLKLLQDAEIPPYLQIYGDPQRPQEWGSGNRNMETFAENWIKSAQEVYGAGGYPGIQISSPKLMRQMIKATKEKDKQKIWGRSWLAYKNTGRNRPPSYPYDAVNQEGVPIPDAEKDWEYAGSIDKVNRWREKEKKPGETIYKDSKAVLGFLAMAKIFKQELGFIPPIICVGGGWTYDTLKDHRYPRVNDTLHSRWHSEMFFWFKSGKLSDGKPTPEYLFAICPAVLSGRSQAAWYSTRFGDREETIAAVKAISNFVREEKELAQGPIISPSREGSILPPPTIMTESTRAGMLSTEIGRAGHRPPAQSFSPQRAKAKVLRYPGPRAISGRLPKAGIRMVVSDPWGNKVVVVSGNRKDYGPGGFQVPVWADADYTLRFLDQVMEVPVREDRVFLDFGEN